MTTIRKKICIFDFFVEVTGARTGTNFFDTISLYRSQNSSRCQIEDDAALPNRGAGARADLRCPGQASWTRKAPQSNNLRTFTRTPLSMTFAGFRHGLWCLRGYRCFIPPLLPPAPHPHKATDRRHQFHLLRDSPTARVPQPPRAAQRPLPAPELRCDRADPLLSRAAHGPLRRVW